MINYDNKVFKVVSNSDNGDVASEMHFIYRQVNDILTCTYNGGAIREGHLIAIVKPDGSLDMRYHHVNIKGEIMTGICESQPEILPGGKIRLHENWKWTSGDLSEGKSILEEI